MHAFISCLLHLPHKLPTKPEKCDFTRDQNSYILLSRARFPDKEKIHEVTDLVFQILGGSGVVDGKWQVLHYYPVLLSLKSQELFAGDLLVVDAVDANGDPYFMASFHGDTNGLQSIPVNAHACYY